jgi:hypothetical protein
VSHPLPRRDLLRLSRPFLEARNARRQRLAKHLNAAGARPTLEALLDVENGRDLDETLEDFGRIPIEIYKALVLTKSASINLCRSLTEVTMIDARALTKSLGGLWCGSYGLVRCPAHDDRKPSLSVRDGEHELIVNCFAGCDWKDIKAEFRRLRLLGMKSSLDIASGRPKRQSPVRSCPPKSTPLTTI